MKKAISLFSILIIVALCSSFKTSDNNSDEKYNDYNNVQDDSFHFYFTIDGIYAKERYAFVSRYMKYPGYKASGKTTTEYQDEAEEGF